MLKVREFVVLAVMVADPPNAIVAPLTVILELVNAEFGILVRVLVEPEIDLLVKV